MMRFQVFLSLWSVTSCLCIDKIPEVAKTKVSKPEIFFIKVKTLPRIIQTRLHMSMSQYGHICIMPPKCSRKERSLRLLTTEQQNPDGITTHFMDDSFVNLHWKKMKIAGV